MSFDHLDDLASVPTVVLSVFALPAVLVSVPADRLRLAAAPIEVTRHPIRIFCYYLYLVPFDFSHAFSPTREHGLRVLSG